MQVAGVPVGKVASIALTPDGEADVAMRISDDGYHPLRRGTRAIIRQASLSGVANRYVDLQLPAADHQRTIPPGGVIEATETASASISTSSSTRSIRRRARRSAAWCVGTPAPTRAATPRPTASPEAYASSPAKSAPWCPRRPRSRLPTRGHRAILSANTR